MVAGIKQSYFRLEQSRQMSETTHRLASSMPLQKAGFEDDSMAAKARVEAEMYQSDPDYCQALAQLKTLIDQR